MKKSLILAFLCILAVSCDKGTENTQKQYIAKIEGFNDNCSTCIISFPDESSEITGILGESEDGLYEAINLNKNDFQIGQRVKVSVRKAANAELNACITLYPSAHYENVIVTGYGNYRNFSLSDTLDLGYKECLYDDEKHFSICFDSVLTDSRCPEDVLCIWQGEAIVRFRITGNHQESLYLDLHAGAADTVFYGYKLSFTDLWPHPNTKIPRITEDYVAKIVIKEN